MDTSPKLYDFVMANLGAKHIPQHVVATGAGVPFSTLTKIAQGRVKDPSVHTIQKLADYFRATDFKASVNSKQPEQEAARCPA